MEALSFLRGDFHLLRFISEHHLKMGGKKPNLEYFLAFKQVFFSFPKIVFWDWFVNVS